MSHGDAGVFIVDVAHDFSIKSYGGYGLDLGGEMISDGGNPDRLMEGMRGDRKNTPDPKTVPATLPY